MCDCRQFLVLGCPPGGAGAELSDLTDAPGEALGDFAAGHFISVRNVGDDGQEYELNNEQNQKLVKIFVCEAYSAQKLSNINNEQIRRMNYNMHYRVVLGWCVVMQIE